MKDKKHDEGKPMVGLMMDDFSLALMEVAKVSTFGIEKYKERGSWKKVQDASNRYEDALCRHSLQKGRDNESGLLHKAHRAWNALAVLELELMKNQEECCGNCRCFDFEGMDGNGMCVDEPKHCSDCCENWEEKP